MSRKSSRAPRERLTMGQRIALIAGLVVATFACVVSAADRAGLPLLTQGSCALPTPRSCIAMLAIEQQNLGAPGVLVRSETLAREYPAMPKPQALHALALAQAGKNDLAATFLLNSARLGWREPAGQSFAYLTAVDEGDAPRAILHLDTLLKLDPGRLSQPPLMAPVWRSEALRRELSARVAAGVPYLPQLLRTYVDDTQTSWAERLDMLDEARARGLKVDSANLRRVMTPASRADPFKALDLWLALMGPGDFANKRLAWDTDVSEAPTRMAIKPFQWHDRADVGTMVEPLRGPEGTAFVAPERLTGRSRELVGIAVPVRTGLYPVSWRVIGPPDAFFLAASCTGNGRAELTQISAVAGGRRTAVLEVGEACAMPTLAIAKARGEVPEGAGIGSIKVGGLVLLD